MNLTEAITDINYELDKATKTVAKCEIALAALNKKTQPSIEELYANMEDFFTVETTQGSYKYILGGDGRSQPWDETRTGLVATISVNPHVYLSIEQLVIARKYVQDLKNPDYIKVN